MSLESRLRAVGPGGGTATVLTLAAFAESLALGVFLTAGPLYFVRVVGLSPAHTGAVITVAGLIGLLVGLPAGGLADRCGTRWVVLPAMALQAIGLGCYVLVRSIPVYAAVAICVVIGERAAYAARGAIMSYAFEGAARVRIRSYLRATNNVAVALGALLGGTAVGIDSPQAYRVALLAASGALAVAAATSLRLPNLRSPGRAADLPKRSVLRDGPFAAVALVNGLMSIHYAMVEIAMPIWVVQHTAAPPWLVTGLFLLNTGSVIAFQVRLSRGVETAAQGAAAQRQSGLLLLVSSVLFALAASTGSNLAIMVLVGATAFHVVAEMRQMAGSWTLGFELAPGHAQGAYQGFYNTFAQGGAMVAPAVVLFLVAGFGAAGWIVIGVFLALLGFLFVPLVRWAQARQARHQPEADVVPIG
jgi:MFS family permease